MKCSAKDNKKKSQIELASNLNADAEEVRFLYIDTNSFISFNTQIDAYFFQIKYHHPIGVVASMFALMLRVVVSIISQVK